MVVLHESFMDSRASQGVGTVGFHEETARIFKDARGDQQHSGQGTLANLQTGPRGLDRRKSARADSPRSEDYNPWFQSMPRCSVIIVTYNSSAHIEACVKALAPQDCE